MLLNQGSGFRRGSYLPPQHRSKALMPPLVPKALHYHDALQQFSQARVQIVGARRSRGYPCDYSAPLFPPGKRQQFYCLMGRFLAWLENGQQIAMQAAKFHGVFAAGAQLILHCIRAEIPAQRVKRRAALARHGSGASGLECIAAIGGHPSRAGGAR